jgi:poly-gamma-glutamate capsule biosynthesis protein CapA/YwtB (metallophosphatase superfamily)
MTEQLLLAVGDIGPYRAESPEKLFEYCADLLRSADLVFCHLDTPYSDRGSPSASRGVPRRGPPQALDALRLAGFDVVSFASNHGMDWGVEPFLDTLGRLRQHHHVVGAGHDLDEARRPAIVELGDGTKVGFLAYCSIVMGRLSGYIADVGKPGVAPLRAWTHYEPMVEMLDYTPGMPARTLTFAYPEDLTAMSQDIMRLRKDADVIVVSQHCGVTLIRAHIAMYQKEVATAAIDAGADVVLQHHAHILRGIGFHRGKPIYYGLGDFGYEAGLSTKGTVLRPGTRESKQMAELYGALDQRGDGGPYVGPEERLYSMAARLAISDGKVREVGYLPAKLNSAMQATVYGNSDATGEEVFKYVEAITREAGLETKYAWSGDTVLAAPVDQLAD